MRLLFSESRPDYEGYVFPYAVWGFLEPGERPRDALAEGFLPSLPDLSRFYLCRQVRVGLRGFSPNSENRRILRKGEGIGSDLLEIGAFDATDARIDSCHRCATRRWSSPPARSRIERIFASPITSHVLVFSDPDGAECGWVTLLIDGPAAFYSNAFYRTDHPVRDLGLFLMTQTVRTLSQAGLEHLHLGTCYSRSALYKTAFPGVDFFDGTRWNKDLAALKYQLSRQDGDQPGHLLEDESFLGAFAPQGLQELSAASPFRTIPVPRVPASIPDPAPPG
jgi:hypothetical protein